MGGHQTGKGGEEVDTATLIRRSLERAESTAGNISGAPETRAGAYIAVGLLALAVAIAETKKKD